MKFRKRVAAVIISIVGGICVTGCTTVPIPTAPKQDQLVLQVDEALLQPVDQLITLKQYKESQNVSETNNRRQRSNEDSQQRK